jgi:lipopolysaccharide/colanic/teichoic acid biosynthesis glycosyltransferase
MPLPKTGKIRINARKIMLERLLALILIVILLPVFLLLSLLIVIIDGWPFWYLQKREGINRKEFGMWKFRSMVINAEKQQDSLRSRNETDGPAFKIHNDPRLTKLGSILRHTGVDELPQLVNIFLGEMSFVGPRPLPLDEGKKVPKLYWTRYKVKPGIISPWVVGGYHEVGFNRWMESDVWYVKNKGLWLDLKLMFYTVRVVLLMVRGEVSSHFK